MTYDFKWAQKVTIANLDNSIVLCEQLHSWYPTVGFDKHVKRLTGIKNKLKGAVGPCLTIGEYDSIEMLKQHLANHPDWKAKLCPFTSLCDVVAKAVIIDRTLSYEIEEVVDDMDRFRSTGWLTNELIRDSRHEPFSIRSVLAVMQMFSARKETYYYSVTSRIRKAIKKLNLSGFDEKEMFSMGSKVPRNTVFETDIDTIRICIAHTRYEISKAGTDYMIHFKNHTDGFSFDADYTSKEFWKFFSDYILFERLLSILMGMSLYQIVMRDFLLRR
jgi:hypothetical protein